MCVGLHIPQHDGGVTVQLADFGFLIVQILGV